MITHDQRIFKIQSITRYEESISKEEKNISNKTFLLGMAVVSCIYSIIGYVQTDDLIQKIIASGIVGAAGLSAANSLSAIISSISRKIMLEEKIEDINAELDFFESTEDKGIRR